MKKIGIGLLGLLLFIGSIGVGYSLMCGPQKLVEVSKMAVLKQHKQPARDYFFVQNILVGAYEQGQWVSGHEKNLSQEGKSLFALQDILGVESYRLYDYDQQIDEVGRVRVDIADGLSGYSNDEIEAMASYGEPVAWSEYHNERWFDLPVKLAGRSKAVLVPDYNAYMHFYEFDPYRSWEDQAWQEPYMATNADHNLLPRDLKANLKADQQSQAIFEEIFAKGGIKDAALNITTVWQGDFDNDGKEEKLLVANTPRGEDGWTVISEAEIGGQSGAYALALFQHDDGSYELLDSHFEPYDFIPREAEGSSNIDCQFSLNFAGAYDLNDDKKYELCFEHHLWEGGTTYVLSENHAGQWEKVLEAHWGM